MVYSAVLSILRYRNPAVTVGDISGGVIGGRWKNRKRERRGAVSSANIET